MTNSRPPVKYLPQSRVKESELAFWPTEEFARSQADRSNSDNESINVAALVSVLRRRWLLIMVVSGLLIGLSTAIIFCISPRYSAQAFLMLDTRKMQVVNIEAVMSGLSTDTAVIRSEVDILHAPMLAGLVVDKLHLIDNPRFNRFLATGPGHHQSVAEALVSDGLFKVAHWLPTAWLNYLPLDGLMQFTTGQDDYGNSQLPSARVREQLIDELLTRLTVANDGKSYGIRLTFEWEDPEIATNVVNTLANLYLSDQVEAKGNATRVANAWLKARSLELRDVVRNADKAVQDYRDQHHIFQGTQGGSTVAIQQLSDFQSQLTLATVDLVRKQAALILRDNKAISTGADSVVLASPLIQQLRSQEAEVARQAASIRAAYGNRHPDAIAANAQLADLQRRILEESTKLVRGSADDLSSLQTRVVQLRQAVALAEQAVVDENQANVRLRELQREAEANQTLYKNFLSRYMETSKQEDLQLADARIISLATVPTRPAFPNKKLFVGISLLLSIMIGTGFAFSMEHLDPTFRTFSQLSAAGIPKLGILPIVQGAMRHPSWVADEIIRSPASAYSEAVRGICNALHLSSDKPRKTILITSAVAGEGKTLFAVSAARSLASSGRRVLLIDCDLRRPTVGKILGLSRQVNLQSVACGKLDFDSAVQVDDATGLYCIASAKADMKFGSYIEFLDTDWFASFLDRLKANYDAIIIDSPPLQVVSDAIVLARYADSALFIVQWGKTRRAVAIASIERFVSTGVTLAGVVLSQVCLRKYSQHNCTVDSIDLGHYHEHDKLITRMRA